MPGVDVRNEDLFISQLDEKERRDQPIVSESSKVTKRRTKKKREEGDEEGKTNKISGEEKKLTGKRKNLKLVKKCWNERNRR